MQAFLAVAAAVIVAILLFKFVFVLLLGLFHGLVLIACTIVWLLALIDILRRQFSSTATKVVWFIVVFFTNVLGAVIYFVFGRPSGALIPRV